MTRGERTNAEMFEKVFGFKPDKQFCPKISCEGCPNMSTCCLNTGLEDNPDNWWNKEYTGIK